MVTDKRPSPSALVLRKCAVVSITIFSAMLNWRSRTPTHIIPNQSTEGDTREEHPAKLVDVKLVDAIFSTHKPARENLRLAHKPNTWHPHTNRAGGKK